MPEAVLRRMNGEHKHTNAHARDIKDGVDTTVDQPWEIDPKLAFNDSYVMLTSYVYLFPKLALLWLPMVILTLPYASLAHCAAVLTRADGPRAAAARGSMLACSSPAFYLFPPSSWGS